VFLDSHAHLTDPAFDGDRDAVVDAARAAGAAGIVCIGASRADALGALALGAQYPGFVFATAGVHPHDAATYDAARDREWMRAAVAHGAVAIGECGLDYHYDNAPRAAQRAAFDDQIALAGELGRPVIVHTRDAEADTVAIVRAAGSAGVRGVLHSFSGSPDLAEAALEAGWLISFSGMVTFKNWTQDAVVRTVPDDRLLVETDAPYLAPVPMRGRRNEPGFVPHIVARLAVVRGTTPEALGARVTANARASLGLATSALPDVRSTPH
jgi:TatD DNase family protein